MPLLSNNPVQDDLSALYGVQLKAFLLQDDDEVYEMIDE